MPTQVNAQNLQTMQVGINGPDGANTLVITTGIANCSLQAGSSGAGGTNTQRGSYSLLLDPVLKQPQFRRSIATGGLANISLNHQDVAQASFVSWSVESLTASWDDDSGKIELRFDVSVGTGYGNSYAFVATVAFQVLTLAAM